MTDSRNGTGNTEIEAKVSCSPPKIKKCFKNPQKLQNVKEVQQSTERALNGQEWNNFNNKINRAAWVINLGIKLIPVSLYWYK